MKYYSTLLKTGPEKYPLIVAEITAIESEGYSNMLGNSYNRYLSESLLFIQNNNVVIYNLNDKAEEPEFKFPVKKEFITELQNKKILLFELHLFVVNNVAIKDKFLEKNNIIEQWFLLPSRHCSV